jgi:hypothetical protein
MAQAQAWLCDRDIPYRALTRYQLKIGRQVSYYPTKGTTFVDGEECILVRGRLGTGSSCWIGDGRM